jgi:hypothetical protein
MLSASLQCNLDRPLIGSRENVVVPLHNPGKLRLDAMRFQDLRTLRTVLLHIPAKKCKNNVVQDTDCFPAFCILTEARGKRPHHGTGCKAVFF